MADPTTPAHRRRSRAIRRSRSRVVRTERAGQRRGERRAPGHPARRAAADDRRPARRGRLPVRARAGRPPVRLAEAARASRRDAGCRCPDADEAQAVTGYERYTITPFGSTRAWPVIADASIAGQPIVAIGGGAHGRQPPPRPGRPRPCARRGGRRRHRPRGALTVQTGDGRRWPGRSDVAFRGRRPRMLVPPWPETPERGAPGGSVVDPRSESGHFATPRHMADPVTTEVAIPFESAAQPSRNRSSPRSRRPGPLRPCSRRAGRCAPSAPGRTKRHSRCIGRGRRDRRCSSRSSRRSGRRSQRGGRSHRRMGRGRSQGPALPPRAHARAHPGHRGWPGSRGGPRHAGRGASGPRRVARLR